MSKYNVGDRVMTIENGTIRKGNIFKLSEINNNMVFVKFDNGSGVVEKKLVNDIVLCEDKSQEEKGPVEKSEIIITPDEFRDIAIKVIAEEVKDNDIPLVGLLITLFVAKLHIALFNYEVEND